MAVAERKARKSRKEPKTEHVDDVYMDHVAIPDHDFPQIARIDDQTQQNQGDIPQRPSLGEMKAANNGDNPCGLTCPKCGCHNFRVDYTRARASGIMRKRFCRACNHPLVTIERPAFH